MIKLKEQKNSKHSGFKNIIKKSLILGLFRTFGVIIVKF